MNKNDLISISRLAQRLDVSNNTVKRWYDWYENCEDADGLVLPPYHYLDARKTRFFLISDISIIEKFQSAINRGGSHYGAMADFNQKHWTKKENNK